MRLEGWWERRRGGLDGPEDLGSLGLAFQSPPFESVADPDEPISAKEALSALALAPAFGQEASGRQARLGIRVEQLLERREEGGWDGSARRGLRGRMRGLDGSWEAVGRVEDGVDEESQRVRIVR